MKNKRKCGFWGTLGCFVGFHSWTWKVRPGATLVLDAPPPPFARCARCGIPYRRGPVRQCGNVVYGDMAGGDIVKSSKPNAAVSGGGTPYTARACSPSPWRRMTPEEYARDFASFPPHRAEVTMAVKGEPASAEVTVFIVSANAKVEAER